MGRNTRAISSEGITGARAEDSEIGAYRGTTLQCGGSTSAGTTSGEVLTKIINSDGSENNNNNNNFRGDFKENFRDNFKENFRDNFKENFRDNFNEKLKAELQGPAL